MAKATEGNMLSCQSGVWHGTADRDWRGLAGFGTCRTVVEKKNNPVFCDADETASGIFITTPSDGVAANIVCCK